MGFRVPEGHALSSPPRGYVLSWPPVGPEFGVRDAGLSTQQHGVTSGDLSKIDVVASCRRTGWLARSRRRRLLKATDGAVKVWCYAPGYQGPNGVSSGGPHELTGFRLERTRQKQAWAEPTEVGRRPGLTEGFGAKRPVEPLFAAVDARPSETLATYPDGSPAVALRHTPTGDSLFVGPPGLTSQLLRLAARRARVHLWTETDCNVYANGPFVVLHGAHDGPVELDVRAERPVVDLQTGRVVGHGLRIRLLLRRGQTRVLRLDPERGP